MKRNLNYLSPLIKKRLRVLSALSLVAILCGFLLLYSRELSLSLVNSQRQQLQTQIDKLSSEIVFGDFTNQSVDVFIQNLEKQIKVFELQKQDYELVTTSPELFHPNEIANTKLKLQKLETQISQYKLDRVYMALASIDYGIFRQDKRVVNVYEYSIRLISQAQFGLQQFINNPGGKNVEPFYVHRGQLIGLQGCTGICTGTHLHFVVVDNGQVTDPCKYLTYRRFTIWGVSSECGLTEGAKLTWPMIMPWIITQRFDSISPIFKSPHRALDLIDRDLAPVMAAHSGWYYPQSISCTHMSVCNNGAAKVASICESQDCKTGMKTEYWHLSWQVGT